MGPPSVARGCCGRDSNRRALSPSHLVMSRDVRGGPSVYGGIRQVTMKQRWSRHDWLAASTPRFSDERNEVASRRPASVSDLFSTRCAAPANSASIVRIRACAKVEDSGRFEATPFQKLRRLANTYTACMRPRTVRHSSFHGEKTGSSSGSSTTSGWALSTSESCKCSASCAMLSARRSTRSRSAGNGHDTNPAARALDELDAVDLVVAVHDPPVDGDVGQRAADRPRRDPALQVLPRPEGGDRA